MIKKTVIIGNGFDIDLGLKTKYRDFMVSKTFAQRQKHNKLCNYLQYKFDDANWIDIEESLKDYANEVANEKEFYVDYLDLKQLLTNYFISEVDYSNINKQSRAYQVLGKAVQESLPPNPKNVTILDFNYTCSVEYLLYESSHTVVGKYGSSIINLSNNPLCIYHVHGKADKGNIVLGVEDGADIPNDYSFLKKSYDSEYVEFKHYITDCDELVVFGHSLGKTDEAVLLPFFMKQVEKGCKPKSIRIYYNGEKDYKSIIKRLDDLTFNNMHLLKENNKLFFVDCSVETPLSDKISILMKSATNLIYSMEKIYNFYKSLKQKR